jgi:ferredoxin-thioredoxin reductase catalytic subunit
MFRRRGHFLAQLSWTKLEAACLRAERRLGAGACPCRRNANGAATVSQRERLIWPLMRHRRDTAKLIGPLGLKNDS